jgi:cytoplasmic iron level regulating protein YaaA (DUF328/UPF0246 family)
VLVLLPPSETKATGGDGPPLALDSLSFPDLTPTRAKLADELVALAADVPAALAALGLTERQAPELERNAALWTAPTLPALRRYTGVLYDALDVGSLRRTQRAKASARLVVASALFGLLAGDDAVPGYRLSAGSSLPGLGTMRALWRPALGALLGEIVERGEFVVDLRSTPYAALAPAPGAVTVRVLAEDDAGRRSTVSHHNKAHKGQLARLLALAPREPADAAAVARIARRGGLRAEPAGDRALDVVVPR